MNSTIQGLPRAAQGGAAIERLPIPRTDSTLEEGCVWESEEIRRSHRNDYIRATVLAFHLGLGGAQEVVLLFPSPRYRGRGFVSEWLRILLRGEEPRLSL